MWGVSYAGELYHQYVHLRRDVRTDPLPLMSSPLPTLFASLTYVWLVWGAAPRFMKNRPPYQLQPLIILYNAFQVLFSTFIFVKLLAAGWLHDYDYRCQPVDYSDTGLPMIDAAWWYFISKFTEFPDTFFFVLRKKFSHASVLHVVHHALMPFSVWWGLKFMPGGHSTFFALANSFVHIVMYTYYMLAAMGPAYRRFIWWKKYLTTFQMAQFVAIFLHSFQLLFRQCAYPTVGFWYIGAHGVLYFALFSNFYNKEYIARTNNTRKSVNSKNGVQLNQDQKDKYKTTQLNGHVSNGTSSSNGHVSNGTTSSNGHVSNGTTSSNGHVSNGTTSSNGHVSNGTTSSNGHVSNGTTSSNGHVSNGTTSSNGHVSNGGVSNGSAINGHASNGDLRQRISRGKTTDH